MKHIVGLGNPGPAYENNRHNAGHMFVSFLHAKNITSIKSVRTDCFMNLSGKFVRKYVNANRIPAEDLFVAHDDLDIPLGSFKIQHASGPKIHNGILSIENELGTDAFWRIRIGVDSRPSGKPRALSGEQYVLSDFSPDERALLTEVFERVAGRLKTL